MTNKDTFAPAVQMVFDRLSTKGPYIMYYPQIVHAGYSVGFAVVFSRLMYHEHLRLKRNAEFFTLTDDQLAIECGMKRAKLTAARNAICDEGTKLFNKELHGMPPINHYAGNHDRIARWLTLIGCDEIKQTNLQEISKLNSRKPANQFAGNRPPLKNSVQELFDVDDAARSRAKSIWQLCDRFGIHGENRLRLIAQLMQFEDGVDIVQFEGDFAVREKLNDKSGRIKNATGLQISRMRDVYAQRTGNEAKHVDEYVLAQVREMFREVNA